MDKGSPERIAYLAGFFDGEGRIRISKHSTRSSYMLKLQCCQATPYPLDMYVDEFGGTVAHSVVLYRGQPKNYYHWQASSKSAENALNKMMQ